MSPAVSRRTLLASTGVLSLAAFLGGPAASLAHADPVTGVTGLDQLRERWVDQITGRTVIDATDADFRTALEVMDTAVRDSRALLVAGTDRSRVFSDADFAADPMIVLTFTRLAKMASAWATPGSAFEGDAAVLAEVLAGLDDTNRLVYNDTQAEYGNWWSWEIGGPKALTDTMAIVAAHLSAEQVTRFCAAVDHFVPDPTTQFRPPRTPVTSTGANRVDICQAIMIRSIVGGDVDRLEAAVAALSPVWQYVTKGDGFFRDGSFVQHSTIGYTGTYGVVLLGGLAKIFSMLGATPYDIDDPTRSILFASVEKSYVPFVHDGEMMDAVRGRAVSREAERGHTDGAGAIEAILWLARAAEPADAERWRGICLGWIRRNAYDSILTKASIARTALVKELLRSGVSALPEKVGVDLFPGMDRAVYRGRSWALSLGMSSNRTTWYECGNGENNTGYQSGSGVTYLYGTDQAHFDDGFWPTADLHRLPGITLDTTPLPPKVEGEWGAKTPANEWTGGVTDGLALLVGQHLVAPGSTGLTARKTWFVVDDVVVALGSDIRTGTDAAVETVVEQRNLGEKGADRLTVDGREVCRPGRDTSSSVTARWAHLDRTGGYVFLAPTRVRVSRTRRTGAWRDVNTGGSTTPLTRTYATLLLDHGVQPDGAAYAYLLAPGATAARTRRLAEHPGVTVVRNDAQVQAVWTDDVSAASFWSAGSVPGLAADGPAVVLVRRGRGTLTLWVADPTQTRESVTVTVSERGFEHGKLESGHGSARRRGGRLEVTVPTAGLAGQSVKVTLRAGVKVTLRAGQRPR